ncbi:MAG: four helix bundle protein [Nitrospirae bacterium]|nr:four helix bundle protein [Nitrospirota bacterium]
MKGHHKLRIWNQSIQMVTKVYKLTESFPNHELYGLTSQIRKSAVSIPSNIAEGAARNSTKEYINFLSIAQGSCSELETQLIIAKNLGYGGLNSNSSNNIEPILEELNEISMMITGLKKSLNRKSREARRRL